MLRTTLSIFVFVGALHFLLPEVTFSQGETTSAIIGQVTDASGAAVPNAKVTVTNKDTGLRRSASTDDSGRFNFPQLKPGTYSVRVEAKGFEPQQNDAVSLCPAVLNQTLARTVLRLNQRSRTPLSYSGPCKGTSA